jgi:hypothetical protein
MTTTLRANTELVAIAWLGTVTGLSTSMVAAALPKDATSWTSTGFVTVRTMGGTSSMYTPLRSPVVTVETWATNPNSSRPPWFQANNLAELIDLGCRASDVQRTLTLPGNYPDARVLSAYLVQEPRRAYGDQGDYAHYVTDLALHWVDLS